MATVNEIHVTSETLGQQLGSWKLIADSYGDEFNQDPFLKEFLSFKMEIAQGFIEELKSWEELGNPGKCRAAIDNAQFFLGQIQVLIHRTLDDQKVNSVLHEM